MEIKDKHYYKIVRYILKNRAFKRTAKFYHHGTTRLEHSLKVSYIAFKIAKWFKLNYKIAAVSGLLHDFYEYDGDQSLVSALKNQITHPKQASLNAKKHFKISEEEQDIIETHMFPLTLKGPKSIEGWIVMFADKTVSSYEHALNFKYQLTIWLMLVLKIVR